MFYPKNKFLLHKEMVLHEKINISICFSCFLWKTHSLWVIADKTYHLSQKRRTWQITKIIWHKNLIEIKIICFKQFSQSRIKLFVLFIAARMRVFLSEFPLLRSESQLLSFMLEFFSYYWHILNKFNLTRYCHCFLEILSDYCWKKVLWNKNWNFNLATFFFAQLKKFANLHMSFGTAYSIHVLVRKRQINFLSYYFLRI